MGTLNLGDGGSSPLAPKPRHKSPGRAFLLSLLLPGLGQFYCGKVRRGVWTLIFFVLSLAGPLFFWASPISTGSWFELTLFIPWKAISVALALYVFAFLDAYFTAWEISAGIEKYFPKNPRVATVLNFLTLGFGYWYLGEKAKGVLTFVVLANVSLWMCTLL